MISIIDQKIKLLQLRNTYEEQLDFLYFYMRRGNREQNASSILKNQFISDDDIKKVELYKWFHCVDLSPFIGYQKDFDLRAIPKDADLDFYRKSVEQLKVILETKSKKSCGGFFEGIEFYTLNTEVAEKLKGLGLKVSSGYAALKNLLKYVCRAEWRRIN